MSVAVRLMKPWRVWSKGHVIPQMQENEATMLISRGIAEKVAEAPANKAMQAGRDYVAKAGKAKR